MEFICKKYTRVKYGKEVEEPSNHLKIIFDKKEFLKFSALLINT